MSDSRSWKAYAIRAVPALLLAILLAPTLAACNGLEEGVCEGIPDAVVGRAPPELPPPEMFTIVHVQTREPNFSSSGDCRVDYEFVIGGVAGIWSKSSAGPAPPMNYFSTTARPESGTIGTEGDRLVVTISVPQREPSSEYEAAFRHPDGRRVETRFHHYGFK
jgi:hypothetical protein